MKQEGLQESDNYVICKQAVLNILMLSKYNVTRDSVWKKYFPETVKV